jgi:P27 family predicted phage terminase small subunit
MPKAVPPAMPRHLDKTAKREWKKEWKRLLPILTQMRVLTEADGIQLGNLCVAYSTLIQAQEKLAKTGLLTKSPNGYIQQSPLLSISNTAMEQVIKLSRECGLSPSSRVRLQMEPGPVDDDGMDDLERALCG